MMWMNGLRDPRKSRRLMSNVNGDILGKWGKQIDDIREEGPMGYLNGLTN